VTASVGNIEAALEISGTLAADSRVPVKPRLPGSLDRVLVDIGDAVKSGQVVATIDRREIDAQADAAIAAVAVARAALESAEASLANAVLEHDRARSLFEKGALPRQRLDAAQTAHRASVAQRDLAAANLAQTEASLRRAREVQRDATVTAPITGFIVERNYDAGATPGDKPVVVVADLRQMKLEAGVSELQAGRLRVGMKARVAVQARPGEAFEGELAAIAPEVDERNRHFRVEVHVPNDGRGLLSGMPRRLTSWSPPRPEPCWYHGKLSPRATASAWRSECRMVRSRRLRSPKAWRTARASRSSRDCRPGTLSWPMPGASLRPARRYAPSQRAS
jgi:RND family efflux transporter MFP subunit